MLLLERVDDSRNIALRFSECGGIAHPGEQGVLLSATEDVFRRFLDLLGAASPVRRALEKALGWSRSARVWRCGNRSWAWGEHTCVMGIVNVTPNSFSDGGQYNEPTQALEHALKLVEEGVDILDIGGESSRPGAEPVPFAEEKRRVLPLVRSLAEQTSVLISVDTYKPQIAAEALEAGAHLINDITALSQPEMAEVVAARGAGVVLMHMQGTPQTMQRRPHYQNAIGEIYSFLYERVEWAESHGILSECIALDPGIGFGKTLEHNMAILQRLDEFRSLGKPLLIGTSRKSLIGQVLGIPVDQRLMGTAATVVVSILRGADIVRVHDVREMKQIALMTDVLR